MTDLAGQLARARAEGGAFALPPRLEIRLGGADAFRYLNGQVTRDLTRLGGNEMFPSCILTPRGKLCSDLLIRRDGVDLIVESDPPLGEALVARLERYIVADNVSLSVEAPRRVIHVFGGMIARESLASAGGICVSRMGDHGKDLDPSMAGDPGVEIPALLDPSVVEVLRIERGIPKWGAELTEETLPPEAGLDRTHIDYDRGCYPGQEVISRLKSIGRVNRLLHGFKAKDPLYAGMKILSSEEKEIGSLTSVADLPGGSGSIALGYLPRVVKEPLFALDPLTGAQRALSITATFGI